MARLPGPQEALAVYGFILMTFGALAYRASGGKREAMSSLIVGNITAIITFITAAGVGNGEVKRGERGFKLFMACVHWALVYPLILAGVFGWRLYLAMQNEAKRYVVPYFAVMILASVATVAIIAANKPTKAKDASAESKKSTEEKSQ